MRRVLGSLLCAGVLACGISAQETYEVRGTVEDVDATSGTALIAHDPIPGFMPAMTMSFDVAPPQLLEGVKPGAVVRFTLERSATVLRITALEVTAPPPAAIEGSGGLAADLDVAAPFALIDQDGAPVALADFGGKAVLLDFMFTRCPGPCPIQTSKRARLQRRLPGAIRTRTALVSISLDPEYDTPSRLREYAERRGADLSNWSFLTGDPETVGEVVASYHIGSIRRPDGQIDHTVATFLIDPGGRIAERYLGLEHEVEEIIADLARVLAHHREPRHPS